ncbi:MAG: 3-dehydroquinate synthase [Rhodospirillaceae bacterium]|nr:MAG: 3-dehydroquinate synthase [Rhodospirillaceae bacterium]
MSFSPSSGVAPPAEEECLTVELGPRRYDIHIGANVLDRAGALMVPVLRQPRVIVVSDSHVAPLYLNRLHTALAAAGISAEAIVLPAGEQTKSFPFLEQLVERLLTARCERRTTLVALGGGVIGDLTGFAAAIVLRGVDFVQIPTTLLSQVDSAVGGKTGIDTAHGKNLVGAFHQPRLVVADTATLETLPLREIRAGYAEVVKYGCIDDPAFFTWLEENGARVLAGDGAARRHAVRTSCAAKARVVVADEREDGPRAMLNLGHTFGHALEAETGFCSDVLHGEAVAVGMVLAFALSVRLGVCPPEESVRLRRHLAATGLPVTLREAAAGRVLSPDRLLEHMTRDKKVQEGHLTFVLARGIGQAFLDRAVAADAVRAVLAESATGSRGGHMSTSSSVPGGWG